MHHCFSIMPFTFCNEDITRGDVFPLAKTSTRLLSGLINYIVIQLFLNVCHYLLHYQWVALLCFLLVVILVLICMQTVEIKLSLRGDCTLIPFLPLITSLAMRSCYDTLNYCQVGSIIWLSMPHFFTYAGMRKFTNHELMADGSTICLTQPFKAAAAASSKQWSNLIAFMIRIISFKSKISILSFRQSVNLIVNMYAMGRDHEVWRSTLFLQSRSSSYGLLTILNNHNFTSTLTQIAIASLSGFQNLKFMLERRPGNEAIISELEVGV